MQDICIRVTAVGKFERIDGDDAVIKVDVWFLEIHNSGEAIDEVLEEEFEKLGAKGCGCVMTETNNHCDCSGYGYEGEYRILDIKVVKEEEDESLNTEAEASKDGSS